MIRSYRPGFPDYGSSAEQAGSPDTVMLRTGSAARRKTGDEAHKQGAMI